MVACTSMEVFAWVTLGGLIANQYVLCSIFYWKKCNYPKISKSFKFLYLFLNIDFLILSNINDPSKIIDIIETKFLKYRYVSVIGSYTVKSCPKVHLFDGKPLGTMMLDFHFQVFWFWCLKFCSYVLFLRQNEWKEPKMTVVIILRESFLKNNSIEVIKVWNCRVLSVKMILKKFWRRDRRLGMNSIYHFICCSFWKFDPAKFVYLLPADFFLRTASALLILTNSQQRIGVCGFF